jgi:hypothetical protein
MSITSSEGWDTWLEGAMKPCESERDPRRTMFSRL